ncbi:hypothetical protein [Acidovorax sp.]|uniref:hypothetical protein n=1 Tax=Acidovorax sp. TaxID=1872122 RepID=UPI0025BA0DA4|nr:hypothetical protein [Acidovorax sp.]MCI5068229.1 hypothetical protein [Acidovorax sp.]
MKHHVPTLLVVAALLPAAALAQSTGEAEYREQCMRKPPQGTPAEQEATRKRCIEEAKKAAREDVPGMANEPGTPAKAGTSKAERDAAREARRKAGAEAARQPKQDPKNPTN